MENSWSISEALGIYVFDRYYDGWPFYVKTTHDFVLFFEYKFNYNSWCIGRDVSGLNTVLCLNYGCDMKCPNYQDYPYRNQKKDCYNFGGGWKTRTWSVYRDLSFRIDCVPQYSTRRHLKIPGKEKSTKIGT